MRLLPSAIIVAVALLCGSLVARADKAKAGERFRRGQAACILEHRDEAIRDLEDGHREEPSDAFRYNIARAHAMAGRPLDAIRYYQKFIDLSEDQLLVTDPAMNDLYVLRGDGAGGLTTDSSYSVCDLPVAMTSADCNGDGHPDVAVLCQGEYELTNLLNTTP